MTIYVVIAQPDGDWDHQATLLGVYTDEATAKARAYGWKDAVIVKCDTDADLDTGMYAMTNC